MYDRLFYPGVSLEVWMEPGVSDEELRRTIAWTYRSDAPSGRVGLVLGAGNVSSIGPMDVLYKTIVEKQAVLLKMHPVNAYAGPFLERGFRPLIEAGALRVAYGDVAEGQHLVHHPGVDEIHMTGSAAVHDRIVWGDTPAEQAQRRAEGRPKVTKPITSELGCVTPVVVVPGAWSEAELQYQAENVATMVALNASCNCNAAKLLVTSRAWPQRRSFLARIEAVLAALPPRRAYYPGSRIKYDRFTHAHPDARALGPRGDDTLPFTTIFDLDPEQHADPAFTEEAWCPILAETALPGDDVGHFLDEAVRFGNDTVEGTLSAVILVDPRSRGRLGARWHRALADLRYGTIAINHWSAMSYVLAVAPWGAYPGHTREAIGSGIGVVHNARMLPRTQKTVLDGPFTSWPKPPWFVTHPRGHHVARQMVAFEAAPTPWRVPVLVASALARFGSPRR
jgi:acyl-CoA reductase-like NAD-dependent aldehyde dehydrogenase